MCHGDSMAATDITAHNMKQGHPTPWQTVC